MDNLIETASSIMPIADGQIIMSEHQVRFEKSFQNSGEFDRFQLVTNIMELSKCDSFFQLNTLLSQIIHRIGFDTFLYGGRFHSVSAHQFIEKVETNYNRAWRQQYKEQHYMQIDPTIPHVLASFCPLVWSDDMYETEMQKNFAEEANKYGCCEGVTLPIHNRNGDVALLSLAISQSGPNVRRYIHGMLGWGALLATVTHDAMYRLIKEQYIFQKPKLTKREIEVLKWVARGKSTWEIARLISISEHGVTYHVRNILLKFDVTSRHQAVAKAIAFGII